MYSWKQLESLISKVETGKSASFTLAKSFTMVEEGFTPKTILTGMTNITITGEGPDLIQLDAKGKSGFFCLCNKTYPETGEAHLRKSSCKERGPKVAIRSAVGV